MKLVHKLDVYGWGKNGSGQLGIGGKEPHPLQVQGRLNIQHKIREIACAGSFTIVLSQEYFCYGFGANGSNQLALGENKTRQVYPVMITTLTNESKDFLQVKEKVEDQIQSGTNSNENEKDEKTKKSEIFEWENDEKEEKEEKSKKEENGEQDEKHKKSEKSKKHEKEEKEEKSERSKKSEREEKDEKSRKDKKTDKSLKTCQLCYKIETISNQLVTCSNCDQSYHIRCLYPILTRHPEGSWLCFMCKPADQIEDPKDPPKSSSPQKKEDVQETKTKEKSSPSKKDVIKQENQETAMKELGIPELESSQSASFPKEQIIPFETKSQHPPETIEPNKVFF